MQCRRKALRKALKAKGLTLRADSSLCRAYIQHGEGDLQAVVDKMVEMDFLHNKTDYADILDDLIDANAAEHWMPAEAYRAMVARCREEAKKRAVDRINRGITKGALVCGECECRLTKKTALYHYSGMGPLCDECIEKNPELSCLKWETLA